MRPWSNDPGLINRYLSCGAGGVQAPHVHMNVQEDLEAVTHLRWVNVHLRNFMARGAREFLAGIRR